MKTRSLLSFALVLAAGCGKKEMDVNVRSVPRMPAPVINVPQAAAPAVNVTPNVTASVTRPAGTFVCPSPTTPSDCDGDAVLDANDQCFNVQQGANADPARPGCPLTLIDANSDAPPVAQPPPTPTPAPAPAPADAPPVAQPPPTPTPAPAPAPVPPPVATPPATSLSGREVATAIQARVNLAAARTFCVITADQVRDGQRAAPDAECGTGEVGCWRRVASARVPMCAASQDAPGCVAGNGTAYGCSGTTQVPNLWVYRCGPRVTGDCNPENLATAAGVQPAQ